MRRRLLVLLVLATLFAVSCGSDGDPSAAESDPSPTPSAEPSITPTPTPTVTTPPSPVLTSACPNEAEVRADQDLRAGGSVSGDVDGDGTEEEVWVAVDPEASSAPCSAFVVVLSEDGTVRSAALDFQEFAPGLPRLQGLRNVNVLPGAEIVVDVTGGASSRFLAIYAIGGNRVVQMMPKGADGAEAGLFAYGGSVGHLEAIDCVEGYIVVSTAVPVGESTEYEVSRRDYQPEGLILIPGGKPQKEVVDIEDLDQFPEFRSGPLGSCPEV